MDEITSPICILFVGSKPPTSQWIKDHAKPLAIRADKVRKALIWLKKHNSLYKDIEINEGVLSDLEAGVVPSYHIDHISSSHEIDVRTARYDAVDDMVSAQDTAEGRVCADATVPEEITWDKAVIADVDGSATPNDLRCAAFRHVKQKGGAYLPIPHDPDPVNEFDNVKLFPMIYPTLYPYGIGGFEDSRHEVKVSMK